MTFRQQINRWFRASFLSSIQAGAIAVKAFASAASGSALGLGVTPLDARQMGIIFLGGFLWHFNDCLASIELPADTSAVQANQPVK